MPTDTRPVHPTYLNLVRRFPLRNIRSDSELETALGVVRELMERFALDDGAEEYLDLLTDVVARYEREQFVALPGPRATAADLLRALIDASGLTQTAFAERVGIAQPSLSAVLSGTRTFSKEHILALAAEFNVSPAVFLAAPVRSV